METAVVKLLSANNYSTWCEDMRAVLMRHRCWQIVIGKESPPNAATSTPKEIKDYEGRSGCAYSLIYLHLSEEYRSLISETDDAKLAWEKLLAHFRPDSRSRVVGLTHEFFQLQIREDEPIGLFAARIKNIVNQLKDAGRPLDEWFHSFQLIRLLPPEYTGIVQNINRWKESDFSKFDNVVNELLAEEARLKQFQNDRELMVFQSGSVNNRLSKKDNSSQGSSKVKSKVRKCFRCGKSDHLIANCKNKPRKQPNNSKAKHDESNFVVEASFNESCKKEKAWVFDTAASSHFCCNKELFHTFKPVQNTSMSVAIDGITCPVEGIGIVKLVFENRKTDSKHTLNLRNVMYSPKLRRNLMAGPVVDSAGGSFVGKGGKIDVFSEKGSKIFSARKENGLYYCYPKYPNTSKNETKDVGFTTSSTEDLEIWHRRFCHINQKYILNSFNNNSIRGVSEFKNRDFSCESCKIAKAKRKSFKPISKIRSTEPLQLLHMDVCGPLPTRSLEGHRYFLTITDDFSRKVTIFPLKSKSDVFDCFTRYQRRAERFKNSKIINVRTDNGLEFCHAEFSKFLEEQGIKHERTNIYTPEENGTSERLNYTAMDAVKTMLNDSGLGNHFWSEAIMCFAYVWNRVCHRGQKKTPFELYGGEKPSVKHFKVFGSTAYVGTPKQLRNKFQMRAKKGTMVGYALKTRGYRIWIPDERKIVETINVTFDENNVKSGAVLDPSLFRFSSPEEFDSDSESESEIPKSEFPDESSFERKPEVHQESDSDSESESEIPKSEPEVHQDTLEPKQMSPPYKDIVWIREAITRKDKSRTDIFYKIQGTNIRLQCPKAVESHCKNHNLEYDPKMFDFSGKNKYSGIVKKTETSSDNEALNAESPA